MLWFCCMDGKDRHRIERNILTQAFKDAPGLGVPHCWEVFGELKTIYRVYTPGPNTAPDEIFRSLARDAENAIAHAKLAPLVVARRYLFVVLVEHHDRQEQLQEYLSKNSHIPVQILIQLVPSVHDLATAIRNHKTTRSVSNASHQ